MLPPMLALRLSVAAVVASSLLAAGTFASCGNNTFTDWACIDPATGKEDSNAPYDPTHYVNGVFDPCHCYDPGGELPQCPILVDAGPADH
jgi:hypothetical protein